MLSMFDMCGLFKRYEPLEMCIDGINLVNNGSPFWTEDKNCEPSKLIEYAKRIASVTADWMYHDYHDALECNVDSLIYACAKTSSELLAYSVLFQKLIEFAPPKKSELYNGDFIRMICNEVLHIEELNAVYLEAIGSFFEDNPEKMVRLSKPWGTIEQLFDAWKGYSDQWRRMILHWIAAFTMNPRRHNGVHPFWYYACTLNKKGIEKAFTKEIRKIPLLNMHYEYIRSFFKGGVDMFLAKDPEQASIAVASFEKEDQAAEARYLEWEKQDAYARFGNHGHLMPSVAA